MLWVQELFRSFEYSLKTCYCFSQIRTIAIIAEGIPEAKTRQLNKKAKDLGVTIIGPATVRYPLVTCLCLPSSSFAKRLSPNVCFSRLVVLSLAVLRSVIQVACWITFWLQSFTAQEGE